MSTDTDAPVRYAVEDGVGRITLDRPVAVNSLTTAMVSSMLERLSLWAKDDRVEVVWLDGAGEKGLCAGGDVRALRDALLAGRDDEAMRFWELEYALNAMVADYPKPYVAWMDGVVMGGGVGVSVHGSLRLVTERTRLAMPETIIGFFPDVGALWHLARAPRELGTHVALTGLPVTGADAVLLGMADHVLPSGSAEEVLAMVRGGGDALGGIDRGPGRAALDEHQDWIEECYAGDDAALIVRRLSEHEHPRARETADLLRSRSPHSVAVTLEALRRAARMDVIEVLRQDQTLGLTFAHHPDFIEGVRALLVDKDRSPRWADADVGAVAREQVLAAFQGG